jgi:uncharacterized protein
LHPFCENMKNDVSYFDLNIHGLEEKTYLFSLTLDTDFFLNFDQDIIKDGNAKIEIELIKSTNLIRLNFDIEAEVILECDRSLLLFPEKLTLNDSHIYKFGEREEEISDQMSMITFGTPKINVADHVFEYIFLNLPAKRIHPDYRNENESETELFYEDKTGDGQEQQDLNEKIDPRWADLLKLKIKN